MPKNATAAASARIVEAMSYDGNGNLVEITDGNGNKTRYEYDAMNRRTSAVYGYGGSLTRTDTWGYDALNMTNRKGVLLAYDSRNRIHTENSRTYSYDFCGRILSVSDSVNSLANVSYTYDALGRTISETNGGKTHFYKYDLANNRIKSSYGSVNSIFENATFTHTLSYAYDNNNRLISITDQQNRTTTYSYDLNGNVLGKTNPSGYVLTNTYDALNRVLTKNTADLKYTYYYDIGGNITRFYEWNKQGSGMYSWDVLLGYDAFDRLISETLYDTNTIYTTTYTYDKNNNRLTKHLQKGLNSDVNRFVETFAYTVNALNQVVGVEKRHWLEVSPNNVDVSNTAISYNTRGNAVQITEGAKSTTINYDAFDMVVSTVSGSEISINTYDYRGRRLLHGFRNSNTDYETSYTYADGTSVAQTKLDLNDTSEKTTLFYRGSDQGGGVGGINYSEFSDGTDLNYKFYNLRGDVIMTIDANDVRKSKYLYFGFGNNELERGAEIATDKHRANTKVEDEEGLLNEGKRFRSLEFGIFLTPDPLEYVDGFNPYIYCNQNPWGRWDPEGLNGAGTAMQRGIQTRIWALQMVDATAGRKAQNAFNENCKDFRQLPNKYAEMSIEVGTMLGGSIVGYKGIRFGGKILKDKGVPVALNVISKTCEGVSKLTSVEAQTIALKIGKNVAPIVLGFNALRNVEDGMLTGDIHSENSFYGDISTPLALAVVAPQIDSDEFDAVTRGIGVAINKVANYVKDTFSKSEKPREQQRLQESIDNSQPAKQESPKKPDIEANEHD